MHVGGSSPFNKKEWVIKEWPVCNRAITTYTERNCFCAWAWFWCLRWSVLWLAWRMWSSEGPPCCPAILAPSWGHSMGSLHGVTPWGHSMGSLHGVTPRGHSMGSLHGVTPRGHSMGSLHGVTPWGHSTGSLHGVTPWGHSTGSLHGVTAAFWLNSLKLSKVKNLFQKPQWGYVKHQWETIWQISQPLDAGSKPKYQQ